MAAAAWPGAGTPETAYRHRRVSAQTESFASAAWDLADNPPARPAVAMEVQTAAAPSFSPPSAHDHGGRVFVTVGDFLIFNAVRARQPAVLHGALAKVT